MAKYKHERTGWFGTGRHKITDDKGHTGIGDSRKDAEESLKVAREMDIDYYEKDAYLGYIPSFGSKLDRSENKANYDSKSNCFITGEDSDEYSRSDSTYETSSGYSSGEETSSVSIDSSAGVVVFWFFLVAIGLAWLFWHHEEKSASNYYQTPTSYYDESYSWSPYTSQENIVTEGEDKKVENTIVREIPSEEIFAYQQFKKIETEANNLSVDMDLNRKNNTESIVKAFEEGKVEMK